MSGEEKHKKKGLFGLTRRLHSHHGDNASVKSSVSKAAAGTAADVPSTPASRSAKPDDTTNGDIETPNLGPDQSIENSPFASAIPHSPGSVTYDKAQHAAPGNSGQSPQPQSHPQPQSQPHPQDIQPNSVPAPQRQQSFAQSPQRQSPQRQASSASSRNGALPSGGEAPPLSRHVSSAKQSRQSTPALDGSDAEDPEAEANVESSAVAQQLMSVLLCEAAADTPAFRASANYIEAEFKELQVWLAGLTARSAAHAAHLGAIKTSINGVIEHFMPPFTNSNILLQDYTTLLFSRFATAESTFWTELIAQVHQSNDALQAAITRLHQGVLARYGKARAAYKTALSEHEAHFKVTMRMPVNAEPAALRDAALREHSLKRALAKTATALVLAIGDVESEVSLTLLDTLSVQALGRHGSAAHGLTRERAQIVIDMHRLRSVSARLRSGFPDITTDLRALRSNLLQKTRVPTPTRDLAAYAPNAAIEVDGDELEKSGWVYMEVEAVSVPAQHEGPAPPHPAPVTAKPHWAFLQNGIFGGLCLNSAGNGVVETVKLATASLDIEELEPETSRAYAFRVRSDIFTITVQTETRAELVRWVSILRKSQDAHLAVPHFIPPPSPEFATADSADLAVRAPGYNAVAQRGKEVKAAIARSDWLRPDSTLTSEGATNPVHTVPSVKPLPTALSGDALVTNWFYRPQGLPNAVTANVWGVRNWNSVVPEAKYAHSFPEYPDNYPRRLIFQDADMRVIESQLPADQHLASDDVLQFVLRGTAMLQKREVPVRMYVTTRAILMYASWRGLVSTQLIDLSRIADIEARHGVDFSDLRLVLQTDGVGDSRILAFRLYIDSATLAKRKMTVIIENLRSRHPMTARELFEHLAIVNLEYSEALRKEEAQKQVALARPGGAAHGLPGFLLENAVGAGTQRGEEDALQIGRGMQTKVSEDTFPIPPEALFFVMFGSKSPVFTGDFTGVIHGTSKAGAWYRRGRFVERRVVQHANVLGADETSETQEMFHYQRVEQQDPNFIVVTERRSAWEMPHGDQFYLVFKYCIYSTQQGCHIQVWNKTVWSKKTSSAPTSEETIAEFARLAVRTVMLRTRKSASQITSTKDALHTFGSARATKVLDSKDSRRLEQTVTRVSARSFASIMMQLPLSAALQSAKWVAATLLMWVQTLSSPLLILLLTTILSLFLNTVLYRHSSTAYWSAHLQNEEAKRFVETASTLPEKGTIFRRAIYTQDLNDAITDGVLWGPEAEANGISLSVKNQTSQCSQRFSEIARLAWTDEYPNLNNYEPSVLRTLRRIADVRENYALRRTDMLSRLRVLNANEREQLEHEYRKWLVSETTMCSLIRPELAKLNTEVFHNVREYCLSCLEEAKGLL